MGTRASFWIGDPRQVDAREWLGCKAFDGYPDNPDLGPILDATTPEDFRAAVLAMAEGRKDFARPDRGWPYPWADDIFLTDYTYAFFGGKVQVSCFHHGFQPAEAVKVDGDAWPDGDDPSCMGVPADKGYDPGQPDSILILAGP